MRPARLASPRLCTNRDLCFQIGGIFAASKGKSARCSPSRPSCHLTHKLSVITFEFPISIYLHCCILSGFLSLSPSITKFLWPHFGSVCPEASAGSRQQLEVKVAQNMSIFWLLLDASRFNFFAVDSSRKKQRS